MDPIDPHHGHRADDSEDVHDSRLTAEDRIADERRHKPRRLEDRVRIATLRRRFKAYRRLALRATSAWAILASAASLGLFILDLQHGTTVSKAERAAERADAATHQASRTYASLQSQVRGECYRVAYLRWQEDRWRYAGWKRDRAAAFFLAHGLSRPIRRLSAVFAEAARQDNFLQQTDCQEAALHPTTYRPPPAIRFERVDPRFLRRFLATPPRPPR